MYKDKFGITKIHEEEINNLSISWENDDLEEKPEDKYNRFPCFLFIPDMKESDHYHISLSKEEAIELTKWLNDYLKDTERRENNGRKI